MSINEIKKQSNNPLNLKYDLVLNCALPKGSHKMVLFQVKQAYTFRYRFQNTNIRFSPILTLRIIKMGKVIFGEF